MMDTLAKIRNDNEAPDLLIYQSPDGSVKVDAAFRDGTLWLSLSQISVLFERNKSTISRHLRNIFESGELSKSSVVAKFATTAADGKTYLVEYYSLEAILAVGYRVQSSRGIQFRTWATEVLSEYLQKGFVLDDERLKSLGGGGYWKELLSRIRDIRSSEKVFYRQVLDLYATSIDYTPSSPETLRFFKTVQNKLHYAAHGHTAAEVIYERANADAPFMGLTSFSGDFPVLKDALIAKNFLSRDELEDLNNLVSGYFDFAELQARRHRPMHMKDYIHHLDSLLSASGEKVLSGSGKISHRQAMQKARDEYRKFQVKALTPVEREYLDNIRLLADKSTKR